MPSNRWFRNGWSNHYRLWRSVLDESSSSYSSGNIRNVLFRFLLRLRDRSLLTTYLQRICRAIPRPAPPVGTGIPRFFLGFSVVGGSTSNWDWSANLISDGKIRAHLNDVEYIDYLIKKTLSCEVCAKRLVIEEKVPGIEYCACEKKPNSVYGVKTESIRWTPFLEKQDIIVWRAEQNGLSAYRMYGQFDDVTANELLEVQLDMSEFRLEWDKNTAQCHVVEEVSDAEKNTLSQIYYWEVTWPSFFSNRDYVCNRRAQVFDKESTAVVMSCSADHPSYPKKSKAHRVQDYSSVLTIRPSKGWNEPGVEFSLQAFENPGVSLPEYITTWVAIRGMPDYMTNLRQACLKLRKKKAEKESVATKSSSDGGSNKIVTSSTATGNVDDGGKRRSGLMFINLAQNQSS